MQELVPRAKTNQDTGMLGLIACACMVIDHLGAAFFRDADWMRVVGRIAFPLFAWGIAVGAEKTRSMGRYALRLAALMLISQPFFMYGMGHAPLDFNIFMTLLLGLLGIWGLQARREYVTAIMLLLAHLLAPDYGLRGVLCILLLWACRENPLALAVCFSAYCVVWGQGYIVAFRVGNIAVRLQSLAILALPLMLIPRATRTPTPRWLMYGFYPAHLAVIWLVKVLIR